MTLRSLSVLQWLGLVGAGLAWAAQHVVGFGIGQAECSPGGRHWGISNNVWELALLGCAAALVVLAEMAAAAVFLRTRGVRHDDDPPAGRMHFFAVAALVANILFLTMMVLDTVASVFGSLCRQG
jgi:hypothetical protein